MSRILWLEKQIFFQTDTAILCQDQNSNEKKTLVPVIAKSSRINCKKFRGPDGKFASTSPAAKPISGEKIRKRIESESRPNPDGFVRVKRKSLVKALDLVKVWTSEKDQSRKIEDNNYFKKKDETKSQRIKQGKWTKNLYNWINIITIIIYFW